MSPSIVSKSLGAPGDALLFDNQQKQWLYCTNPVEVLTASRVDQVIPLLQRVEEKVQNKQVSAAGWLSYEAAPAFDSALSTHRDASGFPLLYFALYEHVYALAELPVWNEHVSHGQNKPCPALAWQDTVTPDQYQAAVHQIKAYIRAGHTYQVNYTYRRRAPLKKQYHRSLDFMLDQPAPFFGGMISHEDWGVYSASPELFFTLQDGILTSRPMKGTSPRGGSFQEDQRLAQTLVTSVKNRAENVMIVDMVRNDISRIATPGTVRVPELFSLEQYPTLYQLTSSVESQTTASLDEIFTALFPPASITGAPKKRTMEIITELESTPRRIYTGTMGFLLPDGRAQFNVAIRTMLLDRQANEVEYGVGSGIVWDSDPEEEYRECLTKTVVCTPGPAPFSLLETMYWCPEKGFSYLSEHLARIRDSATYFTIPLDLDVLEQELDALASGLALDHAKVRVLVDQTGSITLEQSPLTPFPENHCVTVCLAKEAIAESCFLYHKTTNRAMYEQMYTQAQAKYAGVDDVLLYNRRGELTESSRANIIMEVDGTWYTPPLYCGLLPGTARAQLLATETVKEQVLPLTLLNEEHPLYLVNSVRGIYRAKYIGPPKRTKI